MSLVKACSSWFRQTFTWSNSRESWLERVQALVLLAAGVYIGWLTPRASATALAALWGLWLLAAALLLRRGWLKLFGPVLFYDMVRAARRGRYVLLRCFYAGLLLFILFCVWLNVASWRGFDHRQASYMALRFFEAFMVVQLVAVCLLTPAFVAGAISEEKDRKTLEFLLATDLRNREIVLSKFGSRIANLALFVLTGLPILGIIQFLGGVDPTLVLTGFAATGMTVFGLAGLGILNSVIFKKPRDAIGITYLYMIAYVALGLVGFVMQKIPTGWLNFPIWFGADAPTFSNLVTWANSGNVMIAIIDIGERGSGVAPSLLADYALFHGILGLACLIWATVRLRRIALRQAYGVARKAGARHRARPPVGELPMLWKEVSVEGGMRVNWVAAILLAILFLLTLAPAVIMIGAHLLDLDGGGGGRRWEQWFPREMNIWVRIAGTFVACLTLLAVAVRASTSIGSERDKQTLDSLLTSPLDSGAMLWGKFVGCILSVRLAWVWLGLIYGVGLLTGGLHIFALPLVLIGWFVYAACFAALGLWFSMTAKTTMRATVYTMMTSLTLAIGHWLIWMCCGPLFMFAGHGPDRAAEYFAKFQFGLTPPLALGMLAYTGQDFEHGHREPAELLGFCILGIFIWGVAGMIFWSALLSPRFRVYTGREEERYPDSDYDPHENERPPPRRRPPPVPD